MTFYSLIKREYKNKYNSFDTDNVKKNVLKPTVTYYGYTKFQNASSVA